MASTARERDKHRDRSRTAAWLLSPRGVIGLAVVVIVVALYVIGSQTGGHNTGDGNVNTPPTNTLADGHHHRGKTGTNTSTGSSTTTTQSTTTPAAPRKATLALVPTGTVWVCVENQAGKPLIQGVIYTAGQTIPKQTARELLVSLGNAHVNATVDG